MTKHKHLSLSDRIRIEQALNRSRSFKSIGRDLGKDCTTISKEIRGHLRFKKSGCFGRAFNDCLHRKGCSLTRLCSKPTCTIKYCQSCPSCSLHCTHYEQEACPRLQKPPYVCNGCSSRPRCSLEKRFYSARAAQSEYELVRSESRSGIAISQEELLTLDAFLSPLLRKGQSIHHICASNPGSVMFSEKCLYNYLDLGLFSAKNLDLPRKVRFRPRKTKHDAFKVGKKCRVGRSYEDFLAFLAPNPDLPIVQLDSVEGPKGGKVLLTVHFVASSFMLAFLRDANTADSVTGIFDSLYRKLGPLRFRELFPVCLADNGSEFSNPAALEFDSDGSRRTRIFFCHPSSPYEKGAVENNHTLIRRVLPKGASFDSLVQGDIDRLMDHVNSYGRKKLGDRSPHDVFETFYGRCPGRQARPRQCDHPAPRAVKVNH